MNKLESMSTILIPYNCIIDEDSGLLRVIRDKYSNDTVFYMDKIQTDEDIEHLLLYEKYNNVLELVIKPEYRDKMEDFYNEFFAEEYDDIVIHSFITKIYDFIKSVVGVQVGFIILLANNERERKSLDYLFGEDGINIINSLSDINIEDVDILFLKRTTDLDVKYFDKINGKHIHLLDYNFNLENSRDDKEPFPIVEFSALAVNSHDIITLISPYNHEEEKE